MTENGLYYALSTIAQVAGTLAALIGFLGIWRLDRLQDEGSQIEQEIAELLLHFPNLSGTSWQNMGRTLLVEQARFLVTHARSDSETEYTPAVESRFKLLFTRLDILPGEQRRLMQVLSVFLTVTLMVILAPAIVGIVFANELLAWTWTTRLISVASAWLGIAPAYVVWQAARSTRAFCILILLLGLAISVSAGEVTCSTRWDAQAERLHTTCSDGSQAVTRYDAQAQRWEMKILRPGKVESWRHVPQPPQGKR